MELVSEAIVFAVKAHDGMRRKNSEAPYILHPMEVGVIIGSMTDDQEVIAAGVLHDVVEDAGVTIEEIGENFGERVERLAATVGENRKKAPSFPIERGVGLREIFRGLGRERLRNVRFFNGLRFERLLRERRGSEKRRG